MCKGCEGGVAGTLGEGTEDTDGGEGMGEDAWQLEAKLKDAEDFLKIHLHILLIQQFEFLILYL